MTKKEQAIKAVHIYIGDSVFSGDKWPSDFDDKLRSLVHAIDEAEREERGVVFMQEVESCADCKHMHKQLVFCGIEMRKIETNVVPPWCPRRKDNKK